ncbi:hypothetical protein KO529_13495 [Arenibacter algicola]|uniref:hypothetical protein n=1 Tax=Arenibacter algicola TaxID=616991 RepID=UPI001C06D421|nr:hypothetical protein [Arenibacter algicola]MBU2905808.1 hypothetical protein [Arenibacter algicola]
MSTETIQIILQIVLIVIGLYLAFFKSYFSEQGKQIALKEHVEELTHKVERVKAEIDIITRSKIDINYNERLAIMDYSTAYFDWRNSLLDLYPSVINSKNFESIDVYFDQINIKKIKTDNARGNAELFLDIAEFSKNTHQAVMKCMELQTLTELSFGKIGLQFLELNLEKEYTESSKQMELHKKYYENVSVLSDEFRQTKIDLFKEIKQEEKVMQSYLKELLLKNIEK